MQGARRPRGASRRCALQGQCQKNIGVRERSLSQTPVGRRAPFCIGFGLRATKRWAAAPPGGACARCRLRSAVCGARPCDPWAPAPRSRVPRPGLGSRTAAAAPTWPCPLFPEGPRRRSCAPQGVSSLPGSLSTAFLGVTRSPSDFPGR